MKHVFYVMQTKVKEGSLGSGNLPTEPLLSHSTLILLWLIFCFFVPDLIFPVTFIFPCNSHTFTLHYIWPIISLPAFLTPTVPARCWLSLQFCYSVFQPCTTPLPHLPNTTDWIEGFHQPTAGSTLPPPGSWHLGSHPIVMLTCTCEDGVWLLNSLCC